MQKNVFPVSSARDASTANQYRICRDAMSATSRMYCELVEWIGRGDLSRADLRKLIARRPEVYGKFAFLSDTIPE